MEKEEALAGINQGKINTLSTPTILLAEDNADDAYLTTRAMESAGITHSIHHCPDGQAVVEYLEATLSDSQTEKSRDLPDLILLDLKMPRLDGLETLKWIRSHEKFKTLVVMALTSSREEKDVNTAYALHINAYLVKPSSLDEMIELAGAVRQFWLDQNHLVRPQISFSSQASVPRW